MLQKSRFKKKVVVNKAATHALRQEHSAGCVYVCIQPFRKAPRFSYWYKGYYRIFIENFLSNC